VVAAIAVLPGAVYTIARENHGASWAWRKTDAATLIFRFLTASAVFHVILAWASYQAYQKLIVTHALTQGLAISLWWWAWLAAYIIIPYLFGVWIEESRTWKTSSWWAVVRWPANGVKRVLGFIAGTDPEPRAWDRLFSKNRTGYITLKLKDSDEWKAGIWYRPAYASAYGEDQDLYVAEQIAVNADGSVAYSDNGDPVYLGVGLLIRWSEVEYIEFVDMSGANDGSGGDGQRP
jgi:Family of unknown function (DUF6338)